MPDDIRLGYACINMALQKEHSVNRSCIAKTFREKGVEHAVALAKSNLKSVLEILKWNEKCGIRLYRMSSDMFPHLTNPEFIRGTETFAYSFDLFTPEFAAIGQFARQFGHRLTMHPDMFCQVGANKPETFAKTVTELSAHAEILDRIGAEDPVMVVHGGGVYGDKTKTIDRWIDQFHQLPANVKNKIVIENCERQYSYVDVLKIATAVKRPVVFDTHHHACYSQLVEPLPDPSTFIDKILKTWHRVGSRPKFHISEQAPDKRIGAHSDLVSVIPDYLLSQKGIDVMIEAKCKEQAVLRLYGKYFTFDGSVPRSGPHWTIRK